MANRRAILSRLCSKHVETNNYHQTPWGLHCVAAQSALLREDADLTQAFQGCTAQPELVLLRQAALTTKSTEVPTVRYKSKTKHQMPLKGYPFNLGHQPTVMTGLQCYDNRPLFEGYPLRGIWRFAPEMCLTVVGYAWHNTIDSCKWCHRVDPGVA